MWNDLQIHEMILPLLTNLNEENEKIAKYTNKLKYENSLLLFLSRILFSFNVFFIVKIGGKYWKFN